MVDSALKILSRLVIGVFVFAEIPGKEIQSAQHDIENLVIRFRRCDGGDSGGGSDNRRDGSEPRPEFSALQETHYLNHGLLLIFYLGRYSFGIIRLIIQPPTAPIRISTAPAPRHLFS